MTLIGRFLSGEYTVKRAGAGTYVNGTFQPGSEDVIKVKGSGSGLNIKINFGDASEANADADNVEEFTGVKAGEAPLGAGPAECPPGDTSGAY